MSKGVAIGLVGGLFVYAAVTHDPKKSGGLDAALQQVLQQPYGPFMLGAIGIGLICYGLFSSPGPGTCPADRTSPGVAE